MTRAGIILNTIDTRAPIHAWTRDAVINVNRASVASETRRAMTLVTIDHVFADVTRWTSVVGAVVNINLTEFA